MTHTDSQLTPARIDRIPGSASAASSPPSNATAEIFEAGFRDISGVLAAYRRERQRADKLEAQLARFEVCERSTADEF